MSGPWDLPANRVVFTTTEEDVVAAYRLYGRPRPAPLLIRAGIVALGAAEVAHIAGAPPVTVALAGLGGAAWIGMYVAVWWWWLLPRRVHRIYDQQANLQDEHTVTWTAADVETRTEHSIGKAPWSRFHKRREDARTILLFQSDALFHIIPKRALSPEQAASLAACVEAVPLRAR